ncbi:MAG: insulinase family protein [Anaerolineae bacterium]|nr:insulinase family protein [Anaerolineae bacterium]
MTGSYPSPETIARAELPNGITLLVSENDDSPAVVLSGYLWAGSMNEAPEQAGLASLTAAMLLRGTETRSFGEINQALESVGAQLGFHGGVHTAGFGGKALAEDLDLLLDMLADCLRRPVFPPAETERLRGQILTDLQRRAHDTRRMADLAFNALLYPDHPYGRSVQGYEDTVTGLGRDDAAGFYRRCYSPQGMVVVLVGAVQAAAALDKVQAALGDWRAPEVTPNRASVAPPAPLAETRSQTVTVEGKTQADVMLGWLGMARTDPDYIKAGLANNILGVFGMMGRLGDNLRDRQGLAYYVYSRLEAGLGAGPWAAVAGVDPANVQRTVDGIRGEVRRLRQEPVSADDLANSQLSLTGSLPLRLETNEGVAGVLLDMERYGLGLDYLQRYAGLVNAVTIQDIQEMAHRYLDPDRYVLAVAGPPGDGAAPI